jgi:hypothetical protein
VGRSEATVPATPTNKISMSCLIWGRTRRPSPAGPTAAYPSGRRSRVGVCAAVARTCREGLQDGVSSQQLRSRVREWRPLMYVDLNQELFKVITHLVSSAPVSLEEAPILAAFRMVDAAHRLMALATQSNAVAEDAFLAQAQTDYLAHFNLVMTDRIGRAPPNSMQSASHQRTSAELIRCSMLLIAHVRFRRSHQVRGNDQVVEVAQCVRIEITAAGDQPQFR